MLFYSNLYFCISLSLCQNAENNLLVIQRGLVLLKNHLEAFRKRYAYHLRNWHIEGKGIRSHQRNIQEKQSAPIRITLQPAGMADKVSKGIRSHQRNIQGKQSAPIRITLQPAGMADKVSKGIRSHQRNIQEKQSAPIRITLQPAGMADKVSKGIRSHQRNIQGNNRHR